MSRLDDLIKEKCPNGVKYSTIGEVCDKVFAGGTPSTTRSDFYDGSIPWLRSGEINFNVITKAERNITEAGLNGSSAKWIRPKSVLIAMTGATVARSGVNEIALTANQSVCAMEPSKQINYKFLYYFVSNNYEQIKGSAQGALTSINLAIIKQIRVPVPPLEIQNEIVQILDNFAELTAELTAELSNRKKQYEYYRDLLLNFDENEQRERGIKWVSLGDVARRLRGSAVTAGQMKNMIVEGGSIRIFAGGQTMIDTDESFTNHLNVLNIPAVIVKSRGLIDVEYYDKPFTFKQEMWAYTGNAEISTKYIYYILKTKLGILRAKGGKMGSMPQIKLEDTDKLTIPVPSIDTQEKIVKILDRFDKLASDISEGLPAEIEAREKQYAYYRDKLLSFKELASNA